MAILLLSLLGSLFAIISPLIVRSLIDDVLINKNTSILISVLATISGIFLISAFSSYLSIRIKGKLAIVLFKELSLKTFDLIQKTDIKNIQNYKTGDLQSRVTSDIDPIIQTVTITIPQIFVTGLGIILPVFIMFSLDSTLAIIVLSPVLFFVINSWYFGNKMRTTQRPVLDTSANIQSFLKEAFTSVKFLKVFKLEDWAYKKYDQFLTQYIATTLDLVKITSLSTAITIFIYGVPSILVLTLGSIAVIEGTITLGTLTAFMAYVGLFFSPIQQISNLWNNYKSAQASYDRVNEITGLKNDTFGENKLFISKGNLVLDNIWFTYNNRIILKDFYAKFTPGTNYIIGENGSGKTTIINLICGLLSPEQGRILIDDQDIVGVSRESLRTSISIVFSETHLFEGTISDNIRFGNLSATDDEIVRAAKKAELHDFVINLPNGYNTHVGESGINLSSGEKQKIALTRVILRDTPIIIFDEFTRSIDVESKKSINSIIKQFKNKTILIITHDMNDIEENCNVIMVQKNNPKKTTYPI